MPISPDPFSVVQLPSSLKLKVREATAFTFLPPAVNGVNFQRLVAVTAGCRGLQGFGLRNLQICVLSQSKTARECHKKRKCDSDISVCDFH
jgi:hypothetical protein